MSDVRNVIIIGSGPAGYTAAIYAARAGLAPLVFEGSVTAGGALMNTTDVENFPGFPDGIMGPDLMDNLRKQAERFGAELVTDDVTEVDLTGADQGRHGRRGPGVPRARRDHRDRLGVQRARPARREAALRPRRLVVRDLRRLLLPRPGHRRRRRRRLRARGGHLPHPLRARRSPSSTAATRCAPARSCRSARSPTRRSSFAWNSEVVEILGEDKVTGVGCATPSPARSATLDVTGAVRRDRPRLPRSELFAGQVRRDDEGYVQVEGRSTRTNLPGVFAAGDVVDHTYRQAVTAAGTGCAAALDAERYLDLARGRREDRRPRPGRHQLRRLTAG